jgi:hypothetical protein
MSSKGFSNFLLKSPVMEYLLFFKEGSKKYKYIID